MSYETYEEWLTLAEELDNKNDIDSELLNAYCKDKTGDMGLVKDEYRTSDEYITLTNNYNKSFRVYREFNKNSPKKYARRRFKERRQKMLSSN